MPVLTIEKPLREKLGDEASDSLVRLINQSQQEQKDGVLEFVEEKFERRLSEEVGRAEKRLLEKISDVEARLSERISATRAELITLVSETKAELTTLAAETKAEIISLVSGRMAELKAENASTKAELIKWMFIFWVGQVAVILGVLFTFFKN